MRISKHNFHCLLVIIYLPHGGRLREDFSIILSNYIISIIDNLLEQYPDHLVYMMGDFNHFDTTNFQSSFCIENIIHEPTRQEAIIDLILVPEQHLHLFKRLNIFLQLE